VKGNLFIGTEKELEKFVDNNEPQIAQVYEKRYRIYGMFEGFKAAFYDMLSTFGGVMGLPRSQVANFLYKYVVDAVVWERTVLPLLKN